MGYLDCHGLVSISTHYTASYEGLITRLSNQGDLVALRVKHVLHGLNRQDIRVFFFPLTAGNNFPFIKLGLILKYDYQRFFSIFNTFFLVHS